MFICMLKMLWVTLTQGWDTFWTWGILVVPLLVVLVVLFAIGFNGVGGETPYEKVGRIHRTAGWALIALTIVAFFGVAYLTSVQRHSFKDRVIRIVHDTGSSQAVLANRRLAMLTDSNATLKRIAENIDSELAIQLLKDFDAQILENEEDDGKESYKAAAADYLSTLHGVSQEIRDLVRQGRVFEAIRKLQLAEASRGFLLNVIDGEFGSSFKKAFREWFKSIEDPAFRRNIEEIRFSSADVNEADAREIAYRSGFTTQLPVIRFFVRFQQWFRGLLWCVVGVVIGFFFVARGNAIVRRVNQFTRSFE